LGVLVSTARELGVALWVGVRHAVTWACRLGVVGLLAVLVLGKLGRDASPLDLCSHFQVYYLVAGSLAVLWLATVRSWRWMGLAVVGTLISAAAVVPWYWAAGSLSTGLGNASLLGRAHAATSDATSSVGEHREGVGQQRAPLGERSPNQTALRVLVANVLYHNQNFTDLRRMIEDADADVVVLVELSPYCLRSLEPALTAYPHRCQEIQPGPQGIGLFSRKPLRDAQVHHVGFAGHPTVTAELSLDDQPVLLVASHPAAAIGRNSHAARNDQLKQLPSVISPWVGPVVLMGDLNTTMWSPFYQRMETAAGLRNARRGFGVLPTWPSTLPWWMRIPIDHVLVSPDVEVRSLRTVAVPGSDHRGVVADLSL
jgi:endonuclease/exonuclease/phosphatase (EEP) superfamily protein YafD